MINQPHNLIPLSAPEEHTSDQVVTPNELVIERCADMQTDKQDQDPAHQAVQCDPLRGEVGQDCPGGQEWQRVRRKRQPEAGDDHHDNNDVKRQMHEPGGGCL